MSKRHRQRQHISPFLGPDMLDPSPSMRPLIRMLAAQAVRNWLAKAPSNDATSTPQESNEGNNLRTI